MIKKSSFKVLEQNIVLKVFLEEQKLCYKKKSSIAGEASFVEINLLKQIS